MRSAFLARWSCVGMALAACSGGDSGGRVVGPQGEGRASVFLTDAPFPFDGIARVDIHIVRIDFSPQVDTSSTAPGWVTVAEPDRAFNLLDLQNGSTALLGGAVIPADQYAAVRVVIDPARSNLTDTDGHVLGGATTPGGRGIDWQSTAERPVLYAQVEEPMAVGQDGQDIVIDFDVGRSFQYNGNGSFTFIPWLRAITRSGSGAMAGTVRRADTGAPIGNAAVSISVASDTMLALYAPLATSRTGSDGRFVAAFLRPGPYHVEVEDLSRGTRSEGRRVEVRRGATTDAGEFRL